MNQASRRGAIIGSITLVLAAVALFTVGVVAGRPIFMMSAAPLVVSAITMVAARKNPARKSSVREGRTAEAVLR